MGEDLYKNLMEDEEALKKNEEETIQKIEEETEKTLIDSLIENNILVEYFTMKESELPEIGTIFKYDDDYFFIQNHLDNLEHFGLVVRKYEKKTNSKFLEKLLAKTYDSTDFSETLDTIEIPVVFSAFKRCGSILINNETREECTNREVTNFLSKKVYYPTDAILLGITGKVVVGFVIDETGNVSETEIVESVHPLLDEMAKKSVRKLKRFSPAILRNGQAVRSKLFVPIVFENPLK